MLVMLGLERTTISDLEHPKEGNGYKTHLGRSGGDGTKGSGTCGSMDHGSQYPHSTKNHPRQHHISTSTSQATSARWPPAPPGSAAPPSRWSRPCGRRSDDGNDG